ncbi:2-oxoacid:acceptor oxidoreductase subunit alpha [bacterium]|nr:2-oxoacid:acceptor oxidoreductase subunit alpha [bacterium]
METTDLLQATILFAGDSGDGMQLTGFQFSNTTAFQGNDLNTFPDFPAEIRAPAGTVSGVSGFKIHFGSVEIHTPGGHADTLVAMNAAALKKYLDEVKPRGLVVVNRGGFDAKNLHLAGYSDGAQPLEEAKARGFEVIEVDMSRMVREALIDSGLGTREAERSKNMFALGLVYWLYQRDLGPSERFLEQRFYNKPEVLQANLKVLKSGYHYGETAEIFNHRYHIGPAALPAGRYRNITGNEGLALGLIAAAEKAGLRLFYAGYPITPASDILHELSKHKERGVMSFQAEDEIAAVTAAIGAAFGGGLAVTATSGPGMALKTEGIGLAIMLELPLVIVNVQRGGPSTGLPTKTEQSDLFQAVHGRNGEAPLVVMAAQSPRDCFEAAYQACTVALEHMVPVILLSDGYIGNGAEPWKFPSAEALPPIVPPLFREGTPYRPYERDENHVRRWAWPGQEGAQHRIGGLEKQDGSGNVSYEAENHQHMVKTRAAKVERVAQFVPEAHIELGAEHPDVLVIGWGSTHGAIRTAVQNLVVAGASVAQVHLRLIHPFPRGLEKLLLRAKAVLVPELNLGQLHPLLQATYPKVDFRPLHKIKGQPFLASEIEEVIAELLATLETV